MSLSAAQARETIDAMLVASAAKVSARNAWRFPERMRPLTGEFRDQFAESDRLPRASGENVRLFGYEI